MGFFSEMIGKVFAVLGTTFAATGSQACVYIWFDEPEMPKAMIKNR